MPLQIGQQLGAYEITALLGKGGMGEVYRARDSRLKREVAIKVLPDGVSRDPERVSRFQREAEVLALLNHPHIAAIHDLAQLGETRFLVMELVEGETLADRIARGPVALEESLWIAQQIAEALAAAHERGIVHRDLKPANIKITPEGSVKVLDFGLAKALAADASDVNTSNSPTLSMVATQQGIILGTASYMAPEQARGRKADHRADIWAFGVVLYEMLTGRPLFQGEDLTEILASVVKEQPDLSAAPREAKRVLEACLKKDPKQRLQAIGDWRLLWVDAGMDAPAQPAPRPSRALWLAAAAAVLALAGLAFVHFREVPPEERVLQLSVPLPENSQPGFLDLSPDGRRLLLVLSSEGRFEMYLRPLDSPELTLLSGTNGARTPFWSPDGRSIAFFAEGSLKIIPASGGPPRVLCGETGLGRGGTWSRDGLILFASENGVLRRVDAKEGECLRVGKDDPDRRAAFPVFLPDGEHFFYVGETRGDQSSRGVYIATLEDFPGHKVLADYSSIVYVPPVVPGKNAHLVFLRESVLIAQPFDERRREPVDEPFEVAAQGSFTLTSPQIAASAAMDGRLAYVAGRSREGQLTWFDRKGNPLGKVGPQANQSGVGLSPDGNSVAISRLNQNVEPALWLYDLVSGSESRLTLSGSLGGGAVVWSADSDQLWFNMDGTDGPGLYKKIMKSGAFELAYKRDPADPRTVSDLTRDGRFLVYTQNDPKTRADIWYVPLESGKLSGKPVRLVGTTSIESQGQVSPDGKWLAYVSNPDGRIEVYVRAFPDGERVWKVSVNGGREPRWRANSRELFFTNAALDRVELFAATIVPDGPDQLRVLPPERLFAFRALAVVPQSNLFSYSPHPDGQRFLVNATTGAGEATVNVITNWHQAAAIGR